MASTTPDQTSDPAAAEPTMNTREAVAVAQRAIDATIAATAAADEGVAQAEQALAAAEAAVIDTLAEAAVTSDSGGARSRITKARADVEKARDNVEVAHLMRQAADVAYARAVDDAGRAQRAVSIVEYLEAHRQHNDPDTRVNRLQAELPVSSPNSSNLSKRATHSTPALLKSSNTSQKMNGRPSTSLRANPSWGLAKPDRGLSLCGRQHSSTS